jgi:tRNA-dihydrouridine synthase B
MKLPFLLAEAVALAPMAGVADTAFRKICKRFGAGYVTSEMVSAKGLVYGDSKSAELLRISAVERPMALQLFGGEADFMAKAVRLAADFHPDVIDINAGCPVRKVTAIGAGSALLQDERRFAEIVYAVCEAAGNIPVTVKIRSGWDEEHINAVEIAKSAQQNGASAVVIHARTKNQLYAGRADWSVIKAVKSALNIPVIGNGDVTSLEDVARMKAQTGCDMAMIGRGALGRPWVFDPGYADKKLITAEMITEIISRHAEEAVLQLGERQGIKTLRKHLAWYTKGMPGSAKMRGFATTVATMDDVKQFCRMMEVKQDEISAL